MRWSSSELSVATLRNRTLAIGVIAALWVLAPAAAADAPVFGDVFIGQNGTETKMAFTTGCAATPATRVCRSGIDAYGPRAVVTTPGVVTLRFTQPPEAVYVETDSEADAGASPVDPTHWNAIISAPALAIGTRVHVSAHGQGWDAVWVARLDQVAQPDPLRAKVRSVRYFRDRVGLLLSDDVGPYGATFSAYVTLHGRRVSSIARGPLLLFRSINVTLRAGQRHKVRDGGQFVLLLAAGVQHKTVRVTLK